MSVLMPIPYFYHDSSAVQFEIRDGGSPGSSLYHLGFFFGWCVCVHMNFKICFQFMWIFLLEFWWELHQICRLLLVGWSYYFLGSANMEKLGWWPARHFQHYWLTFMVKEGATRRRKVMLSPSHEPCSYEPVTPLLCMPLFVVVKVWSVFFLIFLGEGRLLVYETEEVWSWVNREVGSI